MIFLFILLITLLQVADAQKRCPGGFFIENGRCVPCAPGFYRPAKIAVVVSSKRCFACRAGTYNPVSAGSTEAVCRQCPPNTFSGQAGSVSCTPCPPGLTSNHGASVCLACGPGTRFSPRDNKFRHTRFNPSKCIPCPRGKFSTGPANLDCEPCPRGFSSPKMSNSKTMCHPCPPGRYSFGSGCYKCSAGKFKPSRLGECEDCPLGTTSKEGATSCTPCPKGTRSSRFNERCIDCAPGTTTATDGGSFCVAPGKSCPVLFFKNASGNCESCRPGWFYNVSKGTCTTCPPGSVSRGRLQKRCEVCPPGKRPDFDRKFCVCNDGKILFRDGSCKKCPPGSFSNSEHIIFPRPKPGFDGCNKCSYGMFQDKAGSSMCKPCPLDLVASEEGSAKCTPCPDGLIPNIGDYEETDNVGCVVPTNACPPGWVRQEVGSTDGPIFGCKRVACRVGTPPEDIGKTCLPCDPGYALNKAGKSCRRCAKDEFSKGGIITECEKCPEGLFKDNKDPSKCSCSREGFGLKRGTCTKCGPGTFGPYDSEKCKLCRPGTFQRKSGQSFCEICERGTFAPKAGSKTCRKCPPGTSSARRSSKCVVV